MTKADEIVQELRTYLHMGDSPIGKHWGVIFAKSTAKDAADLIENQKKQIDQQTQTIWGIMHSVDKWLDGKELKGDAVHRAAVMREKVLKIIESLQAENEELHRNTAAMQEEIRKLDMQVATMQAALARVTAERDAAVRRR